NEDLKVRKEMPPMAVHRGFHPIDADEPAGGETQTPLRAVKVLSGFQIALGCLSMVVQGVFTGIMLLHIVQPEMRHFLVSFGVWAGLVFLATGILGLRLRAAHFGHSHNHHQTTTATNKRGSHRALATAFLTMNILSAVCAGILFGVNIINLFWLSHRPLFLAPFYVMRHGEIYLYLPLTGILLAVGVLELVLSAVCASLCCSLRFQCCRRGRGSGGRLRSFTDYPSAGTMDSAAGGSIARRILRSYSQFSLVPAGTAVAHVATATHGPAPSFAAALPPPPSYEEAWDPSRRAVRGSSTTSATTADVAPTLTSVDRGSTTSATTDGGAREPRSNAKVYQNMRLSRTSF
ncbi:hypothetical protein BV898_20161, partial [Hypsibius exemplaris]